MARLVEDDLDLNRRRAERHLAVARAGIEEFGFKVSTNILTGDPVERLLVEAKRLDIETIFLGTRELGLIGTLLLRSVSNSVAARAECSVEIARVAPAPRPRDIECRLAA